jgi:hypothetical protein
MPNAECRLQNAESAIQQRVTGDRMRAPCESAVIVGVPPAHDGTLMHPAPDPALYVRMRTTTRRFCARPSRVLFGATGFSSP